MAGAPQEQASHGQKNCAVFRPVSFGCLARIGRPPPAALVVTFGAS